MKSINIFTCALLATLASAAPTTPVETTGNVTPKAVSVSYDPKYDDGSMSLNTVACSNGANGLEHLGYTNFKSLPTFPLIGGAPTIKGWNSPNCGKCYQLHYNSGKISRSIHVLAIDAAPGGFNIGVTAMNRLTDGMAVELGRVEATFVPVADSVCGL
ncbi:Cerato-platanin [Penicillium riverlandense]|uniref:Cerato-platanin n=1 Tax=Penicillium riverlandense TaxID=1903569 RepID=UPI002548BCE3|nr:Cerato-platanin [Penicillium riverlandense]KAJ5805313.1 Cerato-platanin [Penicillium riverlandense]